VSRLFGKIFYTLPKFKVNLRWPGQRGVSFFLASLVKNKNGNWLILLLKEKFTNDFQKNLSLNITQKIFDFRPHSALNNIFPRKPGQGKSITGNSKHGPPMAAETIFFV